MKPRHVLVALLVAAVWGVNFVVIRVGLTGFPPLLLAGLRFVIAGLPALALPRPAVSWPRLAAIAATLFVGQYGFLFVGMARGLPPGIASVALQIQVFLTVLIAAALLRERPSGRQIAGTAVALAGLAVIGLTVGGDITIEGMTFCMASAVCFATGNVLLRTAGKVDMLATVVWLSVLSAPPLLLLSLIVEGPTAIGHALGAVTWSAASALLYIAVLSTLLGFGLWAQLLKTYSAGIVAPFALLVPVFGAASAWLLLGEQFGTTRLVGMTLVCAGLAVVALPLRWPIARAKQPATP